MMELPRNLTGGVPAGVVDAALLAVESRKRLLLPARRDLSGVEGAGEGGKGWSRRERGNMV